MGIGNFFRNLTKKEENREQMRRVRDQGKDGEDKTRFRWQLKGYEVERTGKGHDFYARKREPFTNRVVDSKYIETKTGKHAKPSKLQKKMKKKYGSRYVIEREDPNPLYNASKSDNMFGSSSGSRKKRSSSNDILGNMFGSSGSKRKKSNSSSGSKRKKSSSNSGSIWGSSGSTSSIFGSSSGSKRKSKRRSSGSGIW